MSEDSSNQNLEFKAMWGPATSIFAALFFYISSQLAAILCALAIGFEQENIRQVLVIYSVSSLVSFLLAWQFLRIKNVGFKNFFGKLTLRDAASIPLFYIGYLAITIVVQSILRLIPSFNADQEQTLGLDGANGLALIGVLMVLVIFPPIAEEVIFRGILYRGLATKWSKLLAALVASLLFGLAHLQWNVGADTFILSLVLIYALEKRKTLWVPIGVHAIKNLVAYILVFVVIK